MKKIIPSFITILFIGFLAIDVDSSPDIQSQEHQVLATDGTELTVTRYAAQGDYLLITIAPGYGVHNRAMDLARQLAARGIEVWQVDLAESLFLPHSTEVMRGFTGKYVADVLQAAYAQTGKKILLSARSYGAIPLLRGVNLWQTRKPDRAYLIGAFLFSPDLYTTIPALGLEPEYVPVTSATNIPIMIFQDGIRGNRWYVDKLITTLKQGGSRPMLKILPGVSALFFKEDTAPETLQALAELPDDMIKGLSELEKTPVPLTPVAIRKSFNPVGSGLDFRIKEFKGGFLPHPIDLKDAAGKRYQRDHYKGQVTVINIWATWCPPCVKEIPSLNRLMQQMQGIPFELISINYAESPSTVLDFLEEVDVHYPVLLDEDGKVSIRWNVIAFPSTFIIGPDGKIHYGVNAAIHWDSPEVVAALKALYKDNKQ